MITIANLTDKDKGRKVIYGRDGLPKQEGTISSWNETYIFVKFGEHANACNPGDVAFAFDHCTVETAGIKVSGQDAQMVIDPLNKYLHTFAATNGNCPHCGTKLGGTFGSFSWGSVNGEGYCTGNDGKCNWPCRAHHRPKFDDGKQIFEQAFVNILPYHPDFVDPVKAEKILDNAWLSLAEALKLPSGIAQYRDMQMAFFGGATTVLSTMLKLGKDDNNEADVDALEDMWNECLSFRNSVAKKAGKN